MTFFAVVSIFPRRLTSVLSKFSHKQINFRPNVSHPLEGVTRGGPPPPVTPLAEILNTPLKAAHHDRLRLRLSATADIVCLTVQISTTLCKFCYDYYSHSYGTRTCCRLPAESADEYFPTKCT